MELPKPFNGDAWYACLSNREQNAISAGNFWLHVLDTHLLFDSKELPPKHIIVVASDCFSSNSDIPNITIDSVLSHNIITACGDDNVKYGTQKVDSALCLYIGTFLMCVPRKKFVNKAVPRGSGTLCC